MRGTQQNWNLVWQEGPYDNHTIGAAALRAPAASREDTHPQPILKYHRPSSLDYRARHGLSVKEEIESLYYIL